MPIRERLLRRSRQLRVRLAASGVLFFAVLMVGAGVVLYRALDQMLDGDVRDSMLQDWAALKAILALEQGGIRWDVRPDDPDEVLLVERLRRLLFVADEEDKLLYVSDGLRAAGAAAERAIHELRAAGKDGWRQQKLADGRTLLWRGGRARTPAGTPYFAAIGRSLDEKERVLRRFAEIYFVLTPALILAGAWLSWFWAGRVLKPLQQLAETARAMSSERLDVRIARRDAEDELDVLIDAWNDLVARLERSFQQIKRFSTDVSHELRTPVTVVQGQLEVALMTAKTLEDYRAATENALAAAQRLARIIQTLLLLAEAEAGRAKLQVQPVPVGTLVARLREEMDLLAARAEIAWSAEVEEDFVLEADRLQLERMLINLIANAIRFTGTGGQVKLTARRRHGEAEFVVEDTGCGIAPEDVSRIFDRFYRARDDRVTGEKGLGLGLSFVAWIVKAHGGRIDVESQPGKGSRFTVVLPLKQAAVKTA